MQEMHTQETALPPASNHIRWAMLASACLVMFGNYYAFDNPAALNQPLQVYMEMSDETYAYFLNILYTSYSLPNIVLPWIGGYAADRFGHRRLLLTLSAMVAFGHLVVCLGVERRHVPAMILGRVLFGAGESLAVTQSAITVKYFRGKELAMALVAFWGGFVSCVISFMTACVLVLLDMRYESTVATGFSRLPVQQSDRAHSGEFEQVLGGAYDPILSRSRKSLGDEEVDMEVLHDSGHRVARTHKDASEDSDTELGSGIGSAKDEYGQVSRQSTESGSDSHENRDDDEFELTNHSVKQRSEGVAIKRQCFGVFRSVLDYSQSFWVLFVMTSLIVGVQVPFNSIHAGFLQMRWYHNDPQKAAQIMTVPDLLSALLVLPIGFFVDHYGLKSWLFMLCGLILGCSHFVLGLFTIPTPVPALVALGIAAAIGATITSAVPVLVKSHQIATAYGILSSAMNLAFTTFPLIVAKFMTIDPSTYTYVEIFFSCCGFGGFLLAVRLRCLDIYGHLDRPEKDNK
ncbi:hypothetical protein BGZ76_001110 [Entomortierella beljakovae]|nr:hypothetical protein BGZ76_001110 [Entomortierella beljakovae]